MSLTIYLHENICIDNPLNSHYLPGKNGHFKDGITIYVLLLEEGKYYIGKSSSVNSRLERHFEGNGSCWTKKYKPIKTIETLSNCESFEEDFYTLKYMFQYGIDNVRGGSFCQMDLPEESIKTLKTMMNGKNDNCFNCGKPGHFIHSCPERREKFNKSFDKITTNKRDNIKPCVKIITNEKKTCDRCGHHGHTISNCYAKKNKDGLRIADVDVKNVKCDECGIGKDFIKEGLCKGCVTKTTINFGKHKGKLYRDVLIDNIDYCDWVMTKDNPGNKLSSFQEWLRKNA
jgi:hypothetical protein